MSLQTRVVGAYIVTEAGPLEAARVMRLAARYQALLERAQEKESGPTDEDLERLQALAIWPQVGACTSPLPTESDWLQIPLTTIEQLRSAAELLNPGWFVVQTPAQEKKTRLKHRKSMRA